MPYDPTRDAYAGGQRPFAPSGAAAPASRTAAITPSDTTDLDRYAKALYVGVSGDVKVLAAGDDDAGGVTFKSHPIGYLPVRVRRVLATGTTATNLVALYD